MAFSLSDILLESLATSSMFPFKYRIKRNPLKWTMLNVKVHQNLQII